MSLLNKAKSKAAAAPAEKKSKGTIWKVSSLAPAEQATALQDAIKRLQELHGEIKSRETAAGLLKTLLRSFANDQLVKHVAAHDTMPEPAMKVVADTGASITFVAQDRSASAKVDDEQLAQIAEIVGEDAAGRMVAEVTDFALNADMLEDERISAAVNDALEAAVEKIVADGVCSQEAAEELVIAETRRRFKHGLLDRLTEFTGKDVSRIEAVLDAMGSSVTRYVKA